ncbi:hypothetical protein D3C81_1541980 [compost metagenome]
MIHHQYLAVDMTSQFGCRIIHLVTQQHSREVIAILPQLIGGVKRFQGNLTKFSVLRFDEHHVCFAHELTPPFDLNNLSLGVQQPNQFRRLLGG